MKGIDDIRKQRHDTDRRKFCIQGSCAAAAALSYSALGLFPESSGASSKEGVMAEEITGVTVKVASVKGTCGLGHKAGDTARITESGIEGKICIHALYSMLPAA
ncbi:MAG: hypothetical protein FJW35_11370, partial [Acidobacteria bacterium]|nr:hypothetical protein [Acidobacteriota bacterium]